MSNSTSDISSPVAILRIAALDDHIVINASDTPEHLASEFAKVQYYIYCCIYIYIFKY